MIGKIDSEGKKSGKIVYRKKKVRVFQDNSNRVQQQWKFNNSHRS